MAFWGVYKVGKPSGVIVVAVAKRSIFAHTERVERYGTY
jgi:hypothetical protein